MSEPGTTPKLTDELTVLTGSTGATWYLIGSHDSVQVLVGNEAFGNLTASEANAGNSQTTGSSSSSSQPSASQAALQQQLLQQQQAAQEHQQPLQQQQAAVQQQIAEKQAELQAKREELNTRQQQAVDAYNAAVQRSQAMQNTIQNATDQIINILQQRQAEEDARQAKDAMEEQQAEADREQRDLQNQIDQLKQQAADNQNNNQNVQNNNYSPAPAPVVMPAAPPPPEPAYALAQEKFATVDLKKLFDNYYKTKLAQASIQDHAAQLDKDDKNMKDDLKKTDDGYQQLLQQANDQALSVEERDKRKQAAADKMKQLQTNQATIDQFERQAQTTLGEQRQRMREKILIYIKDAVAAKAKSEGYSLVFDTAAETVNGTMTAVYTSGDNDLTGAVLAQLNASNNLAKLNQANP